MKNKNLRIAFLIIFIPTVFVILFISLRQELIAWTGCCTPSSEFTGHWIAPDCCGNGGAGECCSEADAIASGCAGIIPCESCCGNGYLDAGEECDGDLGSCGNNEFCNEDCECEQEETCELCDLPECPNPPLSDAVSPYLLDDFYSCTDSGPCPNPKIHFRDCYEVPNNQPDVYFTLHPETEDPTTRGFQSLTHTGAGIGDDEVNEPIRMKAIFIDPDNPTNPNQIETLYIWFSTSTTTPTTPRYIDLNDDSGQAPKTATNNSFGFLMHKEGGSWIPYIPSIVGSPSGDKWVRPDDYANSEFTIKGTSGATLVRIHLNRVGEAARGFPVLGQEVDFDIYFNTNNPVPDGLYNIFGMANKIFAFTPYDNYEPYVNGITYPEVAAVIHDIWGPEQIRYYNQWVDTTSDWNVDLHNPVLNSFTFEVTGQKEITFNWVITDTQGLYGIVGNLYINPEFEDLEPFETTVSSGGTFEVVSPYTPHAITQEDIPGHLQNDYLFKIIGNDGSGSAAIDVNNNRDGFIYLYLTGFDRAGNMTEIDYRQFDLRDWMITQGGLLFSRAGIDVTSRNLDNNLWEPIPLLNKFRPNKADISSELEGDSLGGNPVAPEKSGVVDTYMVRPYDITDLDSYYTTLRNAFERRKSSLDLTEISSDITLLTGNLVNDGSSNIRYMDKNNEDGIRRNLTVGTPGTPFVCNGKGVFFVPGWLIINGKITNPNPNKDACIFIVQGNVTVQKGANSSPVTLGYDPLNAYILTDGTFTVGLDDEFKPIPDGLYVGGGIHSLNGVILDRFLGLLQRIQYPVFVVDHHSKYGVFAGQLFGTQVNMQKVEVGIKP